MDAAAAAKELWRRPWRLQAAVVHGWQAHRERLRAIAADTEEQVLVSSGRGNVNGREAEVLRCWSIADAAAGRLCSLQHHSLLVWPGKVQLITVCAACTG